MGKKDLKTDRYIKNSAEFARPVLCYLRELIHKACPEVEEKIKWGFPHFDYKGTYVSMASFKGHCAFSFWKARLMRDPHGLFGEKKENAMGNFGRIRSLTDLPPEKILIEYLLEAKRLNDDGKKISQKKPSEKEKKELLIPDDLRVSLKKNKMVSEIFENFPYSYRKEYIVWINDAKTEETRKKRIATTIEWTAEGKDRNWKYR